MMHSVKTHNLPALSNYLYINNAGGPDNSGGGRQVWVSCRCIQHIPCDTAWWRMWRATK